MKRIENCEINEIVRPVMDGWYSDGGSGRLWQSEEYYVHKFLKDDRKGRLYGPYSAVIVRDGAGLDYCLNYGRFVISRLESPPSLSELAAMPQEFWVSSNGQYYEPGVNRSIFLRLCVQAESRGTKIVAKNITKKIKSTDRSYAINMDNIASAAHLSKQATVCLSLIIEAGKAEGISENDLAELLRQNGGRLNTKQDPWKIFNFYRKTYLDSGILEIREPEANDGDANKT